MLIHLIYSMSNIFPQPILNLPEIEIPLDGAHGYLVQGEQHQIVFITFEKDVNVPEHSHAEQWEIVLEGKVDYYTDGKKYTYKKGDRFFVQSGTKHSAKIYAGYAAIMFFNEKTRYSKKSK